MINTEKSVIKMGDSSKGITLPREIADIVEIGKKYIFIIDVIVPENEDKTYKCSACELIFTSNDECPACPACMDNPMLYELNSNDYEQ